VQDFSRWEQNGGLKDIGAVLQKTALGSFLWDSLSKNLGLIERSRLYELYGDGSTRGIGGTMFDINFPEAGFAVMQPIGNQIVTNRYPAHRIWMEVSGNTGEVYLKPGISLDPDKVVVPPNVPEDMPEAARGTLRQLLREAIRGQVRPGVTEDTLRWLRRNDEWLHRVVDSRGLVSTWTFANALECQRTAIN
jgi:hypothetical protein